MRTISYACDGRIYGTASDSGPARLRYGRAVEPCRDAMLERTQRAAELGRDAAASVENLEILRAQLHVEVDQLVDAAELAYPSPLRLIFRAPRYRESP